MKYNYSRVIQQFYGHGYGWEDVSTYETRSNFISVEMSGVFYTTPKGHRKERTLISHDLIEYRLTGYPTRLINRRELNALNTPAQ